RRLTAAADQLQERILVSPSFFSCFVSTVRRLTDCLKAKLDRPLQLLSPTADTSPQDSPRPPAVSRLWMSLPTVARRRPQQLCTRQFPLQNALLSALIPSIPITR
ncbi:unnamed protein product, partial [Ectocarpus sp. 12 AP-2014]